MKLKSLLLGSAAALATVTGAQAADAIMAAAPEPVDYVRVCDAFGTGYFYIPGTETCLKIGGYIRQDIGGGEIRGGNNGLDTNGDGTGDAWFTHTRFSLQTDTKSDTELGVLHTFTEVRFNYTNGVSAFDDEGYAGGTSSPTLNFAYIELGGFRVGKTESEFTRLAFYGHGYAGGVIDDTLVGYGPKDAEQISYTFKSNGFAAVIAAEDDNGGSNNSRTIGGTVYNDTDYVPDVIAGLSYDNGTIGAAVIGAYDSSLEEGAIKVRADASFGMVKGFLMGAFSTNGNETGRHGCPSGNASITSCGSNHFANWGGDYAVYGGLSAALTQKVAANIQLSYDDDEDFGAAGNLVFHVVPGFDVTTEVDYADTGSKSENRFASKQLVDKAWGGVVRFQRTF